MPLAGKGAAPSPALLVRALSLCYFSGPTAQAVPLATGMQFAGHWCRLWQVRIPPQAGAYAYLAEVAPGLLALAYLSAARPEGELQLPGDPPGGRRPGAQGRPGGGGHGAAEDAPGLGGRARPPVRTTPAVETERVP